MSKDKKDDDSLDALAYAQGIERQRAIQIEDEIKIMEKYYEAAIAEMRKILETVEIGEFIHLKSFKKRIFQITEIEGISKVSARDIKTGRIVPVNINDIQKIDKKTEKMAKLLYERRKKV